MRQSELYGFEDTVDGRGGCELTPFALLLPVHPAILPSLSFLFKETIFIMLSETEDTELFLYLTCFIK